MKSRKPLWKISVATSPEAEDAVAESLGVLLGRSASSYLDIESAVSTVSVFCEQKPAIGIRKRIAEGLRRIKNCGLATGPGNISIARVRREDWAESWKRHFKPIEIKLRRDEFHESLNKMKSGTRETRPSGKSLLIKPSWSRRKALKNQAVLVLDPGLTFGTGRHPTTAFCLHQIVAAVCDHRGSRRSQDAITAKSFLDIGTGSGILAIAAAKLGFSPVDALDFDPDAVRIAHENARKNDVAGKIRFRSGDVAKLPLRPARRYDLICANLISTLLITERRRIAAQLRRGGTLVLAGILKSEFALVKKSFAKLRLKPASAKTDREWQSGSFRSV